MVTMKDLDARINNLEKWNFIHYIIAIIVIFILIPNINNWYVSLNDIDRATANGVFWTLVITIFACLAWRFITNGDI